MILNGRKKIVILIFGGILIFAFIGILIFNSQKDSNTVVTDDGGIQYVTFVDEGQAFYKSVTYADYQAIQERMTDYVQSIGGKPDTDVVISPAIYIDPNPESTTMQSTFSIPSLNISKQTILFDYGKKPLGSFTIKEASYTKDLYTELD